MTQPISSFNFMHRMNTLREAQIEAYAFEQENEGFRILLLPRDNGVVIELINTETDEERQHMILWQTVDTALCNPISDWIELLGSDPIPEPGGPVDDLRQAEYER